MYYVYVLENENSNLYYGSTNDLKRRLSEHHKGRVSSTKGHQWELIYYEAYRSEADARKREHNIKLQGQAATQLRKRIRMSRQTES